MELATIIDTDALLQTGLAALIAGVGVALTFSLAILGVAQSTEMSREGRPAAVVAYAVLAVLGMAATLAAIVFGIIVMTGG